jgi:hypothetical protein
LVEWRFDLTRSNPAPTFIFKKLLHFLNHLRHPQRETDHQRNTGFARTARLRAEVAVQYPVTATSAKHEN